MHGRPVLACVLWVLLLPWIATAPANSDCNGSIFPQSIHTIVTGSNPLFIAHGDFNGDGFVDLAVTNSDFLAGGGANSVSVLLGAGGASFLGPSSYALPSGAAPHEVVAVDINGDGILDLITADTFASALSVLKGRGDGTFTNPVQYPTGGWSFQLIVHDFNEDGILDVATTINNAPPSVNVLLGQDSGGVPTGTFGPPLVYPISSPSTGLAGGDFNGDGILDLVATENVGGTVGILLGRGAAGGAVLFDPVSHFPAGTEPFDIAVADFNRDGILDLAVANTSNAGTAILLGHGSGGHGDGTFGGPAIIPSGNTGAARPLDFNEDGILDLAVGTVTGTDGGAVRLYLGNGTGGVWDGTFTFQNYLSVGGDAYQVVVTDVDGDGHDDLIASAYLHDYIAVFTTCDAPAVDPRRPDITTVRDVPGDQGGRVFVTWTASSLDAPTGAVNAYRVWRRIPPALAAASSAAAWADGDRLAIPTVLPDGTTDIVYWEALATLPAQRLEGYGYTAATFEDSTASSTPYTAFFVTALTADLDVFYSSLVDSGYSVDNTPPAKPGKMKGKHKGHGYLLTWSYGTESDLDHYDLYRGSTAYFDSATTVLVASVADSQYLDRDGSALDFYWLAAVDVHDNPSEMLELQPSVALAVDDGPGGLALAASPNPVRTGELTIAFTLPDARAATIDVLDVTGRRVFTLSAGNGGAGSHTIVVGGERRLAPGIYVIRLVHPTGTRFAKAVVVE